VYIFAAGEKVAEHLVGEYNVDFMRICKNPPFRLAVCHQPLRDGRKFQLLNAIWFHFLISKDQRVRTKFHQDLSLLETQYELLTYGIPVQQIPRTHSGNIKVKNHLQWIKTRIAIDQFRASSCHFTTYSCNIIGHPRWHDVLFCRGGNASYPGNVEFGQDVDERIDIFMSNPDRDSRRKVRDEIIACVEARNGRFLQLQEGGWWEELSTDKVHEKIKTFMYDYHRRLGIKGPQQSTNSETSVFLPNNKRQKVRDESTNCGVCFR
jgi:hypothetical protein